jgi:hypothetical protein
MMLLFSERLRTTESRSLDCTEQYEYSTILKSKKAELELIHNDAFLLCLATTPYTTKITMLIR